ncbi:hypothetical protein CCPUN_01400 [Cardinium endosymbiont of Culicoides punctatus]|nr:hypothetical protein CCPUN_01400 [Cardinium endosymbiont of Culicoides punctatus]
MLVNGIAMMVTHYSRMQLTEKKWVSAKKLA